MCKMKLKSIENKKGQGWGIDLIIAVSIFSVALIAFYVYSLNMPSEAKENIEILSYEGKILTNTILSENNQLGILSDNKINETKLQNFYNLTKNNYQNTKKSFNLNYDYYFFLDESMDIGGNQIDGIGKPEITRNSGYEDAKNLIKITRYTIYKNKPMTAYFYIFK